MKKWLLRNKTECKLSLDLKEVEEALKIVGEAIGI